MDDDFCDAIERCVERESQLCDDLESFGIWCEVAPLEESSEFIGTGGQLSGDVEVIWKVEFKGTIPRPHLLIKDHTNEAPEEAVRLIVKTVQENMDDVLQALGLEPPGPLGPLNVN